MTLLALFVIGPVAFLMAARRERPGAVRHLGLAFPGAGGSLALVGSIVRFLRKRAA